jgi:aminopeptidase N
VIAANADAAAWDQLRATAQAEKTSMIKSELYDLLASAKDKALAQRALDLALTDEPSITSSASMIGRVAGQHPDLAFDFAVAHQEQMDKRVDVASRSRYFPGLGARSADPAMVGKLRAYAKQYLAADAQGDTKTAIASIEYRVKVRTKRLPEIDAWLAKHG